MAKVLVTGGLGYIGSHCVIELQQIASKVIIIDNECNSNAKCFERLQELAPQLELVYEKIDLRDKQSLNQLFQREQIDVVIHFAALKAVGESGQIPLDYYDVNVSGTVNLLLAMKIGNCNKIVYSSSACVYGNSGSIYKEDSAYDPINVYGRTKVTCELIIKDAVQADQSLQAVILRYFNPVGAHESGRIGEYPSGIPNNLVPYIQKVVVGKLEKLSIFGKDFPTEDETAARDYIHVVDLAKGHISAIGALSSGVKVYNLGTGRPTTVLQLVNAYQRACGKDIPYEFVARREGDAEILLACPDKAENELNWRAQKTIDDMCVDSWRWISNNPEGYIQEQ